MNCNSSVENSTKSLGDLSGEISSGFSCLLEFSLPDQSQNQVVDASHHLASVAHRHAGRIFLQGHVSAVMQTSLNTPMGTPNLQ